MRSAQRLRVTIPPDFPAGGDHGRGCSAVVCVRPDRRRCSSCPIHPPDNLTGNPWSPAAVCRWIADHPEFPAVNLQGPADTTTLLGSCLQINLSLSGCSGMPSITVTAFPPRPLDSLRMRTTSSPAPAGLSVPQTQAATLSGTAGRDGRALCCRPRVSRYFCSSVALAEG